MSREVPVVFRQALSNFHWFGVTSSVHGGGKLKTYCTGKKHYMYISPDNIAIFHHLAACANHYSKLLSYGRLHGHSMYM